jgi:hypothetical protein
MKKLNSIILALAVTIGGAVVGHSQIRQGLQEVSFAGSYVDQSNTRNWNLTGSYGFFFTDQAEVLGIVNLNRSSRTGQNSQTTGGIGAGLDWHFPMQGTPNFVPFVGASYLIGIGSGTPDALEIHAGIKQFVTRNVAIKYQVGYGFDPSDSDDTTFRASVGLSYFF